MGLLFMFELSVRQQLWSDFKNLKFFPTFGPMEFLKMVSIVAKFIQLWWVTCKNRWNFFWDGERIMYLLEKWFFDKRLVLSWKSGKIWQLFTAKYNNPKILLGKYELGSNFGFFKALRLKSGISPNEKWQQSWKKKLKS